jgi:hypothetical protein
MTHLPEDEWIRYRIKRLLALRKAVYDAQTLQAIDELIAEAEERLQALEALKPDHSS